MAIEWSVLWHDPSSTVAKKTRRRLSETAMVVLLLYSTVADATQSSWLARVRITFSLWHREYRGLSRISSLAIVAYMR